MVSLRPGVQRSDVPEAGGDGDDKGMPRYAKMQTWLEIVD